MQIHTNRKTTAMKIGIYFLFYVAMIMELLIFIVERDDAEESLRGLSDTIADSLAANYSSPLRITVRDTLEVPGHPARVTREIISVAGLWTREEWRDLRFHIVVAEPGMWQHTAPGGAMKNAPGWTGLARKDAGQIAAFTDERTGSGVLDLNVSKKLERVGVWCETRRHIPGYLPAPTRDRIHARLKEFLSGGIDSLVVPSDTAWFSVRVAVDIKKPRVISGT